MHITCYSPLDAWQNIRKGGSLIFDEPHKSEAINYRKLRVECRKCIPCRRNYQDSWSLRIAHESQTWPTSTPPYFTTFTYDNEHLPEDRDIHYEDFQNMLKRVRASQDEQIRYVCVPEYGEKYGRVHYHANIWGLEIPDLTYRFKRNDFKGNEYKTYSSDYLNAKWGNGMVNIGLANNLTNNYLAGYLVKHAKAEKDQFSYIDEETGEFITRKAPRIRPSNRPGIGAVWAEQYYADFFPSGTIHHNGKVYGIPDYYLKIMERNDPDMHEAIVDLKQRRMEQAVEPTREELNQMKESFLHRQSFFKQNDNTKLQGQTA